MSYSTFPEHGHLDSDVFSLVSEANYRQLEIHVDARLLLLTGEIKTKITMFFPIYTRLRWSLFFRGLWFVGFFPTHHFISVLGELFIFSSGGLPCCETWCQFLARQRGWVREMPPHSPECCLWGWGQDWLTLLVGKWCGAWWDTHTPGNGVSLPPV